MIAKFTQLSEVLGFIEAALQCLDRGASGKEYDPSWIRPRLMKVDEVKAACESAYHLLFKAKAACIQDYAHAGRWELTYYRDHWTQAHFRTFQTFDEMMQGLRGLDDDGCLTITINRYGKPCPKPDETKAT